MVGKNQQSGVVIQFRQHLAQHLIDLLIKLADRRSILSGKCSVVSRMLRVH